MDNLIQEQTTLTGNIQSTTHWEIRGKLIGNLVTTENVYIEEKAEIKGNISGKKIEVLGKVYGNLHAQHSLNLYASSSVVGDITYGTLVLEEGAQLTGRIQKELESTKKENQHQVQFNSLTSQKQDPFRREAHFHSWK